MSALIRSARCSSSRRRRTTSSFAHRVCAVGVVVAHAAVARRARRAPWRRASRPGEPRGRGRRSRALRLVGRQLDELRSEPLLLGQRVEELACEAEPPEPLAFGDGSATRCRARRSRRGRRPTLARGARDRRCGTASRCCASASLERRSSLAVDEVLQAEQDDQLAADPRRG